tara:strand:- start:4391 stop:4735 length:345 start_codon:yes stop_codon:yes gene_type:complete
MITTLGHKHKQAQGWLGNKLHSVRRAGSKLIHSNVVKVGVAALGVGLAVNEGMKTTAKEGAKVQRMETEARRDTEERTSPEDKPFVETTPTMKNWFSDPSSMTREERLALGYPA